MGILNKQEFGIPYILLDLIFSDKKVYWLNAEMAEMHSVLVINILQIQDNIKFALQVKMGKQKSLYILQMLQAVWTLSRTLHF